MKFKMVPETLYTTINYIDRYLEVSQVRRSRLQLAGVACLLVSLSFIYYIDFSRSYHYIFDVPVFL